MAKKESTIVRVSSKYQVVIPPAIRSRAGIRPGAEFQVVVTESGLRLVPVRPLQELRGRVRRDETIRVRDKDDRT